MRTSARSAELLAAAVDDALTHGIGELSLRPLAARLGTSDRMLLYHFESKDDLVAALIEGSSDRGTAMVEAAPAASDPEAAVLALWAMYQQPTMAACLRIYVQAAALGLLGTEPYRSAAERSNETWGRAVADYLLRSGAPAAAARRCGDLVDATLFGLVMDAPLDELAQTAVRDQIVADLATAVGLICRQVSSA